jgi:ribokinase
MNENTIVVVGSANMDIYVSTSHLPEPGETVIGKDYLMTVGGKGANQAVAARKLGANVLMVGKVGNDSFGRQILDTLKSHHIGLRHFQVDDDIGSGMAVIIVDEQPQNVIAVTPGANMSLSNKDIDQAKLDISAASVVLAQLEIPLKVVEYVADITAQGDGMLILNPAPASPLPPSLLRKIDILTPNQTEAKILTGIESDTLNGAELAGIELLRMGVNKVVLTLGDKGSMLIQKGSVDVIPSYEIEDAVDPSGAGDAFMGGLAVGLSKGMPLKKAIKFGNLIGGISTRKPGAMPSMPSLDEVEEFLGNKGDGIDEYAR